MVDGQPWFRWYHRPARRRVGPAELLMGGWLVISLSLHFDYVNAIALSLIYSGLLLLICAWIYGYWMQSQSELD